MYEFIGKKNNIYKFIKAYMHKWKVNDPEKYKKYKIELGLKPWE